MPAKKATAKKASVYIATTAGSAEVEGVRYDFSVGELFEAGHPLTKLKGFENFLSEVEKHARSKNVAATVDEKRD